MNLMQVCCCKYFIDLCRIHLSSWPARKRQRIPYQFKTIQDLADQLIAGVYEVFCTLILIHTYACICTLWNHMHDNTCTSFTIPNIVHDGKRINLLIKFNI